jgi:hypothetical protein
MPVRVVNRSRSLVTVSLNSGESIHLAPDEASGPIDELEVDRNAWVEALLKRRWIAVERAGDKGSQDDTQATPAGGQVHQAGLNREKRG